MGHILFRNKKVLIKAMIKKIFHCPDNMNTRMKSRAAGKDI